MRILVLEDQPILRGILCGDIKRLGHTVISTTFVETALEALTNNGPFDLAILDTAVPGNATGGLFVARFCAHDGVPFIGTSLANCRDDWMRAGAIDFLLKPFKSNDLERVLAKVPT